MKYNVVEIFSSIEGEGRRAGQLATFVRLAGCNLRCSYCDTPYARKFTDGRPLELAEILRMVDGFGNGNVTLTGGEPLAGENTPGLLQALLGPGREVNVETNGSWDVGPYLGYPATFLTMDWKTPSSGCSGHMLAGNLALLRPRDVLKIVMDGSDFDYVSHLLQTCRTRAWIYLGPVFGRLEPAPLVEFAKRVARLPGVDGQRLCVQLQLHKIIWGAGARGV